MFLPRFVIGCSKRWCDWSIYKSTLGCLGVPLLWDGFFFRFCTISVWMYHETSARCRASRSVKQSNLPLASSLSQSLYSSPRHLARPHESIPSPRSSQCCGPPLHAHINQSHRPDLVSVVRPHGSLPQINSITPIQSRAPIARPHNSIPLPTSSQSRIPMACPHKSIPSPRSSRAPPWHVPINQCQSPVPASVAHPH